ncbi:terminase small subunit [Enterococcus gallinarum]|uniref:terminase small subunit n=1 Tax=Enterococcus gallinarum TaxID=1353 RepID=UPI002DBF2358|nr:terminase small subunit [Enterococcus gallinarum]MEB5968591.1 terminase small subunit [Enterococcus gallinarum]
MKLTEKQRRFADEYIISGNATQAAISAGYSKRTAKSVGSENLTKPDIRQYIDERLEQLQSEKIASQEEVLEYLSKVMRGKETDQTVVFQGSEYGSTIEDVQVANKDRIRAAELLGKRYSLWTDKVELDGNIDLKVVVDYGDGENETPDDS